MRLLQYVVKMAIFRRAEPFLEKTSEKLKRTAGKLEINPEKIKDPKKRERAINIKKEKKVFGAKCLAKDGLLKRDYLSLFQSW